MQQDTYRGSASDPLSLNLYTYCHNEPMMYYDPTGHSEKSALDLIGEIIAAKEIYEEEQKKRDKMWFFQKERHSRTEAQEQAASSAETARSSMKSTKAYEDPILKKAIDSYLEKEYGGTMADVLDLQKTIISYNSLINYKNGVANQKSIPTVEPHSNEGTGKTLVAAQQLIDIGWNDKDIDIDEINRILVKYEINTTERIQHFITQVSYESGYGKYTREGEYLLDSPYNFTQEEYEAYYNKKSNYKYKDRGVGYIQTTFNYQHKFFATDVFREKYPQYELSKVAYNHPEAIDPVYNEMLKIAKNNNIIIKTITDINDLGTDYIANDYSWEITGWWWKQHSANELVDKLNTGDVDSVSRLVNKWDTQSFSDRSDIYKVVKKHIN